MKQKQYILFMIILLSLTLLTAGCPTILPVTAKLRIVVTDIKNPRMEVGQSVEIEWDYEEPGNLERQKYVLVQHTILGEVRNEFEIGNEARELSFIFQAPTTVFIMGFDSDTDDQPVTQVAVDILYSTDYFLNASIKLLPSDPNTLISALSRRLPRLGYPKGLLERTISFTNFVGIRDAGDLEVLDFFKGNESGFNPQAPFRMISVSRDQSHGFDTVEGSGFPMLCHKGNVPLNCHTAVNVPEEFESAEINRANALVFGGALAYGGHPETVKTSSGDEVTVHYDPDTTGEPIFIVIAMHSGVNNFFAAPTGNLEIVDLYIGNVTQRLVVNAFAGTIKRNVSLGSREANYNGIPPTPEALLSGNIKGANITDTFVLSGGAALTSTFTFTNVEWQVPFRNDNDLLGIPTVRHLCELTNSCQGGE